MKRNKEGICTGFRVSGHAGYAQHGQDIVCAAVSVLVINTVNSIEAFTKDKFSLREDEKAGIIELDMVSEVSRETKLLLDSLILGLTGIKEDYGSKFIKIC